MFKDKDYLSKAPLAFLEEIETMAVTGHTPPFTDKDEERIDVIGQNGNEGDHYVYVTDTSKKATDKQVGGEHYKTTIQPIEYILANNLGFIEGNVIKYITRYKDKNGAEDIKKAIHYLEILLQEIENG